MPLFEVFIPTHDADGFDITARIRADSWIHALRNGLSRLGDTADVRNIMCDIREDGIHVTEPRSGRVFKIREVDEASASAPAAPPVAAAPAPTAAAGLPVTPPSAPPPRRQTGPQPAVPGPGLLANAAAFHASAKVGAPAAQAVPQRFSAEPSHEESIKRERRPAGAPQLIGRGRQQSSKGVEDLLGELFLAVGDIYEHKDMRAAANFVLDLAVKSVPADAGSVFVSSINGNDLYFAAARGPKAEEVMKFRVGMGQGIVGFSAMEGVSVAVSDAQRDPRFFAAISQRIGYETHSIVCAPAQQDGRTFGALQLINKKGGSTFSADDMSVLEYLAGQFAQYLINTDQTNS